MDKKGEMVDNSFGLVSFIFGVLSVLIAFLIIFAVFSPAVGFVLSVLGVIFGFIQIRKGKTSWAVAGLILSFIGLLINSFILARVISALSNFIQQCNAFGGCEKYLQALTQQQVASQLPV
ncbi:hypothetical protein J4217_03960 [Candidatus Pacearchaeota archaeon]|nr:hypothetical protein [uncultured archaeon]AQS33204.1 hypothetical protein [uncultured archaeon]MBS3091574.1 hypothetical protein [Candidatus Pacearchaeota archaeon]